MITTSDRLVEPYRVFSYTMTSRTVAFTGDELRDRANLLNYEIIGDPALLGQKRARCKSGSAVSHQNHREQHGDGENSSRVQEGLRWPVSVPSHSVWLL